MYYIIKGYDNLPVRKEAIDKFAPLNDVPSLLLPDGYTIELNIESFDLTERQEKTLSSIIYLTNKYPDKPIEKTFDAFFESRLSKSDPEPEFNIIRDFWCAANALKDEGLRMYAAKRLKSLWSIPIKNNDIKFFQENYEVGRPINSEKMGKLQEYIKLI